MTCTVCTHSYMHVCVYTLCVSLSLSVCLSLQGLDVTVLGLNESTETAVLGK